MDSGNPRAHISRIEVEDFINIPEEYSSHEVFYKSKT